MNLVFVLFGFVLKGKKKREPCWVKDQYFALLFLHGSIPPRDAATKSPRNRFPNHA